MWCEVIALTQSVAKFDGFDSGSVDGRSGALQSRRVAKQGETGGPSRTSSGWRRRAPRILVVDKARGPSVGYLRYAGFHVDVARDGASVLERARRSPPPLVAVLDTELLSDPGPWELADKLREDSETAGILLIGISPRPDEDAAMAHASGFHVLLAKPCPPERLTATVLRLVGVARREAAGSG